jgi:hypothetical protein
MVKVYVARSGPRMTALADVKRDRNGEELPSLG